MADAVGERETALRRGREHLAQAQRVAHTGSWQYDLLSERLEWSEETLDEFAHCRAGGRRAYNAQRRFAAAQRLADLARLLSVQGSNDRGIQAKMARRFGVSRSTMSRDFAALRRLLAPCRACGAWHSFPPPGGPTAGA